MKIYILTNLKKINIKNLNNLNQTKVLEYQNIYSSEGIFRIQNNNIYKLIPKDYPLEKITYNNLNFILNKNNYKFTEIMYYTPYNHIKYDIKEIEYKLDINSKLSLIIEYNNNNINKIYFSTNENELNDNLKNNMFEFILLFSLVNDIKQS